MNTQLWAFFVLLAAHGFFDWLTQWQSTAYGKLTNWFTRLNHSLVYGIAVCFNFQWALQGYTLPIGINLEWLLYLFVTHFVFDTPAVKRWWMIHVKHCPKDEIDKLPEWLWVGVDQWFHFISLAPIVWWICFKN